MEKFKLEELPVKELQALGLHDGKKSLLDENIETRLLSGGLSNFVQLNNIKIGGASDVSLDAKLSLHRRKDGSVGLLLHPIYKDMKQHQFLSPEENQAFSKGGAFSKEISTYGKITRFGDAPYQFDEQNKQSFFIELEKRNGEKKQIWGIDLQRAMEASGKKIGDEVQIKMTGKKAVSVEVPILDEQKNVTGTKWETTNRMEWEIGDFKEQNKQEKTVIYEFDPETNSFVSLPEDFVQVPEEINGMPLTAEQKQKYKKGDSITMADGATLKASPAAKDQFRSDRRLLIFSLFIDGGLTYLLYKGIQALVKNGEQQKQMDNHYSKGYMDALKKVQVELEQKQARFPNDAQISKDINIVKNEMDRVSPQPEQSIGNPEQKVGNIEENGVNDPELEKNASDKLEEKVDTSVDIFPNGAVEILFSGADNDKVAKLSSEFKKELESFPETVVLHEKSYFNDKELQKITLLNSVKEKNPDFQNHVISTMDKYNIDYSDTPLVSLKNTLGIQINPDSGVNSEQERSNSNGIKR